MPNILAIEKELQALFEAIYKFKSSNRGFLREQVPINQMPSLDIMTTAYSESSNANIYGTVEATCIIRYRGYKRNETADEFKSLINTITDAVLTYDPISFDAIRQLNVQFREELIENSTVWQATIQFDCLGK